MTSARVVGGFSSAQVAPVSAGYLVGTVGLAGAPDSPVLRRVQLVLAENAHGHVFPSVTSITWKWSDENGNWRFESLDPALKYHVIAYDHTGVHDPVIKINLVPTVE